MWNYFINLTLVLSILCAHVLFFLELQALLCWQQLTFTADVHIARRFWFYPSSGFSMWSLCACVSSCLFFSTFCFSHICQSLCPHYRESKSKNSLVMHQSGEHFCWRPFVLSADLSFIVFVLEKRRGQQCPCISSVCVCLLCTFVCPLQRFPHSLVCSGLLRQKDRAF